MTISLIFQAIVAALQFPDAVVRLAKLLQASPEANHEAIIAASEAEARGFEQTGRPKWD